MRNVPVHRIVAKEVRTAYGENPEFTALVASSEKEDVEVVFKTLTVPAVASALIQSSQEAVRQLPPLDRDLGLANNVGTYLRNAPDFPYLVDLDLMPGGEVLSLNVGSGLLCLRLTEPAKEALKKLAAHLD